MKKYSESVLEYKNSFKNLADLVSNTDKLFKEKYFPQGSSRKKFTPPFIPGQIYSFYYSTESKLGKDRLFINRNPIVLCTDVFKNQDYGTILKGIDIITIPPAYRVQIIAKIFDSFSNTIEKNDSSYDKGGKIEPILLKDTFLERALSGTGYKKSLFGFKASFMEKIKILDLDDWYKLPYLKESLIEGLDTEGIYKEYKSKLIV
jgi:hypothetical protein